MLRKNKGKLLVSSLITLIPALVGLGMWRMLPEQMAVHWNADGAIDGYGSRAFAVLLTPLLMLAMHWICVAVTALDPKNRNQTDKAFGIVLWICPAMSLLSGAAFYAAALGVQLSMDVLVQAVMGLMFVLIGNYLPKCKQNYTLGIKVKWALENEENWNATHRFGGKAWVIGGILMMAGAFLPSGAAYAMIAVMLVLAFAPMVYSYLYYRKQRREGTAVFTPLPKLPARVSFAIAAVILAAVAAVLFTGEIAVEYGDQTFTIAASYWPDRTVSYADIDALEYRETGVSGSRTNGFGSPRLLMGTFQNEEFGSYTRYTYTRCDASVVMRVNGAALVISGRDAAATKEIYETLLAKTE